MLTTLTRRALVTRGGAALAGVAGGLLGRGALAAPKRRTVYRLAACGGCAACNACRLHAANKLFASTAAADAGRAHPGCNCGIVEAGTLPAASFVRLFQGLTNPRRPSVDRRRAGIDELLAKLA